MLDRPVGYEFRVQTGVTASPSQRLHLILLGVDSVAKASEFYESLGWKKSSTGHDGFVKFDLGGYALCLLPRNDLAKDALYDSPKGEGFSGIGLVYLAKTPEEVPMILQKAVESGGTLVKPATRTPWGIAGYFKDPDGHLFEVDYEKPWVFDEQHKLVVDKLNN
jgi:predicted lactoylglutathione lyase